MSGGTMPETTARTSIAWRCSECSNTGTIDHDSAAPIKAVVGMLNLSHATVSPECHRRRGLTRVRATLDEKSA